MAHSTILMGISEMRAGKHPGTLVSLLLPKGVNRLIQEGSFH